MNDILHHVSIMNQDFASDAFVYSVNHKSGGAYMAEVDRLLKAQEIIEAKWLGAFPVFVFFPEQPEDIKNAERLYEDTMLVLPDEWLAVDDASMFLVNQRMLELCPLDRPPHFDMTYATADGLLELSEREMFVVATLEVGKAVEGYGASSGTGVYGPSGGGLERERPSDIQSG